MSLVNALLNGGTVGAADVDVTRYGHSSAPRIAMESAAELHEIFMESFYNVEQAELAAATEGVALEGSQYEAVAEAAIKNAATKIKEFLQKLWAKVKAFFHNIKRYLDSIFMSGADFVKKYQKEIDKMGKLEDYTVKMYNYDDDEIDSVVEVNVEDTANELLKGYGLSIDKAKDDMLSKAEKETIESPNDLDMEKLRDDIATKLSGGKCKEYDEFEKWCFGAFRNGAEGSDDKEDRDINGSDVERFAKILAGSKKLASKVDSMASKTDSAYSKAVKVVGDCEKALDKVKDNKNAVNLSKTMRQYSTTISTCQSMVNTKFNAWKAVIKERDSVYKQVIMGAFSNAKKTAKADK